MYKEEANRIKELKEQFKTHLQRLGYSESTSKMLPVCIAEFLQQMDIRGIYNVEFIQPRHIKDHYEYLTERPNRTRPGGLSSRMINHHMYAIRLFLTYLQETGQVTINPISGLTFPRAESTEREVLTQKEIKLLYETCKNNKERAVLNLFYGCGLRRSEAVALNLKDISLTISLLYVREGKRAKRRVVPINKSITSSFKHYLHYERHAGKMETAFMVNAKGRRMQGDTYNNLVKKLVDYAGIEKQISLHNLRHSIATHLLESGLSVEYVRDFLGHKNLEATQVYTRISNQRLQQL